MKIIFFISSIISSSMFMMMKHPLSMGFMLFLQTMLTCLMNGMNLYSFWFSYILFITFIGGMLVLFIYIASVASNEKFMFSNKLMFMIIITMVFWLLISIDLQIMNNNMLNEIFSYSNNMMLINNNTNSIMKMFNYPYMLMTILMIVYLLITMVSIVKITNIKEGPLRMKN